MSTGEPPPLPLRKPPGYRDPNIPIQHALPRKAVKLPPSFQTPRRRRRCCRVLCCFICIFLLVVLLLLISVGFLFYLWYQPRLPEINLKSINFTKFNVTTSPDNGPVLDVQSNIGVVMKNPNRNFWIVYGRTHISLNAINGDVNLGEQTAGAFTQGKSNVTTLRFSTRVQREIVDGKSAEELKKGFKNKNLVMNAEIRTGIGFKKSRWSINPVQVNVLCDGMRLSQVQGTGSGPRCHTKVLNWFYIN